jgi:dTDP-glucose 4,6-dehydratase/UDP-glucose 4-epimerase
MQVVIFGSNGFIGSHVSQFLSSSCGYQVTNVDLLEEGVDPYFRYYESPTWLDSFFKKTSYDLVINCAGAASVPKSLMNPWDDFTLNCSFVFTLLDAIRAQNCHTRFINLSSAAVYGNPKTLPVTERSVVDPLSPYGYHKLAAEMICSEFHRFWGIPTLSLRVFSAYGPGLRKQLFWDVYQRILNGENLVLGGTGFETRDFIFIDDISHAIEIIIRNGLFDGGVINVASGLEITINEAVSTFLECYGSSISPSFSQNQRPGDPLFWRADIQKLISLGFVPRYTLQQGLTHYVQWLKDGK